MGVAAPGLVARMARRRTRDLAIPSSRLIVNQREQLKIKEKNDRAGHGQERFYRQLILQGLDPSRLHRCHQCNKYHDSHLG